MSFFFHSCQTDGCGVHQASCSVGTGGRGGLSLEVKLPWLHSLLQCRKASKPKNAHKCMRVYYTYRIPSTCFGHSYGRLQGGALQKIDTSKYYGSFRNKHRYRILNFKNNSWLKIHTKVTIQIKVTFICIVTLICIF